MVIKSFRFKSQGYLYYIQGHFVLKPAARTAIKK